MVEMVEQFLKFDSDGIEKKNFHSLFKAIEYILISNKFAYGRNKEIYTKYFIGYKTDEELNHYSSRSHK